MKIRLLIIIGIIIAIGSVTTILAMNFSEDKKTTVSDTTMAQLEAILEHCIDSKDLVETVGLSYYNNTHFIDTITCEWQRHDGVQIDSEGLDANSEFEFTQKLKNARDILLENQDIIPWTGLGVSTSEKAVTISIDDENPEEYRKIIEKLVGENIPIIIKKGGDPFINSGWVIGEDYCQEWCDNDELYKMGCDQPILAHLTKYSNLLDEEFNGTFNIDLIGLPDGVSTEKFEECVDIIYEKRLDESKTKKLWKSTDDWNSLRLIRNDDGLYCSSASEESSDKCYSLKEIVFGNARKSWTVFPGGVGPVPPENFTLTKIYKDSGFAMPTLNFEAMLDDKIFVNKCESNGGVWNYTYHDCENLWQVCRDMDGKMIQEDITKSCTEGVCLDGKVYRISCVFEYEK